MKLILPPSEICMGRASFLVPFLKRINEIEFAEEPPYGELQHILTSAIMDKESIPNMIFDWNENNSQSVFLIEAKIRHQLDLSQPEIALVSRNRTLTNLFN
jgi:hypothetical protein